jgi:hypothetical protein
MPSNSIKKSLTVIARLIACVFAILIMPLGNIAFAQSVFDDGLDIGVTSFYTDASSQARKVEVLKDILGYDVAVPLNIKDLKPSKVGNGVFQGADLDFSTAEPKIPGTATRIQISGPVISENGENKTLPIFSVVAGKPQEFSCPVEIEDTQIAFFETSEAAKEKADSLESDGYLVYVSVDTDAQEKAIGDIEDFNCRPDAQGIVVNGKTQQVTVDFTKVFNLLPPRFQQAAREEPFVYFPKGDAIYLVNARKIFGSKDLEVGLFDADTDELIAEINDKDTLHLKDFADRNLTISATVPADSSFVNQVGSILIDLNDGQLTRTENISPYAIFGDNPAGDLNSGDLELQETNTISFEVFDRRRARGNSVGTVVLSFDVDNN